eukprot:CAMPEP_0171181754 /NCGR_PEP_ID=MMETSP0790-20130122/14418_1 /TAXON_ID=2925 /ORGANISM="Alexandrium catenella, Strain OF101" /LENGTH=119 /DNA_ID=CAMNT_0011646693 /DNA_START=43 /DNA_END=402 /DNA_ORIENTATION=-
MATSRSATDPSKGHVNRRMGEDSGTKGILAKQAVNCLPLPALEAVAEAEIAHLQASRRAGMHASRHMPEKKESTVAQGRSWARSTGGGDEATSPQALRMRHLRTPPLPAPRPSREDPGL